MKNDGVGKLGKPTYAASSELEVCTRQLQRTKIPVGLRLSIITIMFFKKNNNLFDIMYVCCSRLLRLSVLIKEKKYIYLFLM